MSSHSPSVQHVVTAIIVAHDGAAWIPHVTRALAEQSRPVDRAVGVDAGSRDRSGAMLAEALGRGAVFGMDRSTGYAAAVHQALRHRAANSHLPPAAGGASERVEWVWLLHDDCEPAPDALESLLRAASQTPSAAVLGPKAREWSDRRVLLEAGFTIDRVGRRITGIEPREIDQGQHDGDRDVMAVGSAGMLVRRDVWDRVGGFDPSMRLYRDDIDFCWRVLAAGQRVRLVTDAVVYHVEASARNRRRASAAPRRARQDRRNALLVLGGNLPLGPMLASLAGALVLSLMRTVFFLLAKRPRAALDEASAAASVVFHPADLAAARRRRARGRRAAYSRVRAELPSGRSLRKLMEYFSVALSSSHQSEMVGSHHAASDPADDDWLLTDTGVAQRILTNPGVLLCLGLAAVTLVAARSLLAAAPLSGGALVPAWGGASALWQEYLQGFHPVGIGTAASAPPYVAVIAAVATLLGGKPWLAVNVILIGCVPLAGATAFLATRRVTAFMPARVWAALSYALLPVGIGTVAAGRLGAAVVLVLLPLAGALAARMFTEGPRRARRAAWATALVVAVAASFVPLAWLIAVVVVAVASLAFARGLREAARNVAIVTVTPFALLLPWSIGLAAHPARILLESGLNPPGLSSAALPARSVLMLSPGGPGLPPFWVSAGLLVAAALALVAPARRTLVLVGWGVALTGLIVAAGVSRVIVAPGGGGSPAAAWPGVALAVAGAGLALAGAAAGESLSGFTSGGRWRGPRGVAVLALAAVAASAPALAAAYWVTGGVRGPVRPSTGPVLPEFVSVSSSTGLRLRTLVLRGDGHGGATFAMLRAAEPPIGSEQLGAPPAARRALALAVAKLTAPAGSGAGDQGRALAAFGIGYVLMPSPVNPGLAALLDSVPGLRPVSQTSTFELWRVVDTAASVTVAAPDGVVAPVPSGTVGVRAAQAPAAGGTLVLAEPAGGWRATLNGRPLTPTATPVGGWAQGFTLPAGGGTLTVTHNELPREVAVGLEGFAVLVVAALALPGARVAADAPAAAAGRDAGRGRGRGRSRASRHSLRDAEPPEAEPPDAFPGEPEPEAALAGDGEPRFLAGVRGGPGRRARAAADDMRGEGPPGRPGQPHRPRPGERAGARPARPDWDQRAGSPGRAEGPDPWEAGAGRRRPPAGAGRRLEDPRTGPRRGETGWGERRPADEPWDDRRPAGAPGAPAAPRHGGPDRRGAQPGAGAQPDGGGWPGRGRRAGRAGQGQRGPGGEPGGGAGPLRESPARGGARLAGPGRLGDRGRARAPGREDEPDRGPGRAGSGPGVPWARPPADDGTLPPLPPLPPRQARSRRPAQDYRQPGEEQAGWDRDQRHDWDERHEWDERRDPGESDW